MVPRVLAKRFLPIGTSLLIFIGTVLVLLTQQKCGLVIIPAALLPAILLPILIDRWINLYFPIRVQSHYALLLLAGPYTSGVLNRYDVWPIWDTLVHLYSGFVVTLIILVVLSATSQRYSITFPLWFEVLVLLAIKVLIAVLWEMGEFAYDHLFSPGELAQLNNYDTMIDMLSGLGPAVLIAAMLIVYRRKGWFSSMRVVFDPCTVPAHA
ncbi:MAG TPA: hypothetical protein H9884_01320 [Candidatus Yaniella excrementigallinarum]|nr:hypothetical protein [Candidatus Yaniella excrementigallinarum]